MSAAVAAERAELELEIESEPGTGQPGRVGWTWLLRYRGQVIISGPALSGTVWAALDGGGLCGRELQRPPARHWVSER